MKKILLLLTSFAFLLVLPMVFIVHAQSEETQASEAIMIAPDGPIVEGGSSMLFGQDHSYTVTFRGNGEAVVNMKAVFTNYEEATMSAVTLQVPRVNPQNLAVYQVVREKQCVRYAQQKYNPLTQTYDPEKPECLHYQEPNYYSYYDYNQTKYFKADVQLDGDMLTITLPQGISPQSSGSYILYYRALGYTSKDMYGVYNYTFETLKTEDTIRNLMVGVTTDSDLTLKGASSQVEYDIQLAAPNMGLAQKSDREMSGAQFDSYYQRIGSGKISKSASELQPNDSFTVTGSYATSLVRLYGKNAIIILTLTIGLIAFAIALIHRFMKRRTTSTPSVTNKLQKKVYSSSNNIVFTIGLSFGSSIIATVFTIVLYLMMTFMNRMYYSEMNVVIGLFLLLISCMIYPVILVGPGLYMGLKRGLWWGVGTFAVTIMWLGIYLCIIFFYLFISRIDTNYPQPMQYMERSIMPMNISK